MHNMYLGVSCTASGGSEQEIRRFVDLDMTLGYDYVIQCKAFIVHKQPPPVITSKFLIFCN